MTPPSMPSAPPPRAQEASPHVPRRDAADLLAVPDPDRAWLELVVWDAADRALHLPGLGRWLERDGMALVPALWTLAPGSLWHRGFVSALLEFALREAHHAAWEPVVWRLASHPERTVWMPAVRALGSLAARSEAVLERLLTQAESENPGRRRRGVCALASAPPALDAVTRPWLEARIASWERSIPDVWEPATLGAALPALPLGHWLREEAIARVGRWCETGERAHTPFVWSVAQGLASILRGRPADGAARRALRDVAERWRARAPFGGHTDERMRRAVIADDAEHDGAPPGVARVDRLVMRMVAEAVRVGAGRVVGDSLELGAAIGALQREAYGQLQVGSGPGVGIASALACFESTTLVMALRPWEPIALATGDLRLKDPCAEVRRRAREALEDVVRDGLRRPGEGETQHRAVLRAVGLMLDGEAVEDPERAPGREPPARFVLGLLAVSPLTSAKRDAKASKKSSADKVLRKSFADVLWRVYDQIAGSAEAPDEADATSPRLVLWGALMLPGTNLTDLLARSRVDQEEPPPSIDPVRLSRRLGRALVEEPADLLPALTELSAEQTRLGRALLRLSRAVRDVRLTALGAPSEGLPNDVLRGVLAPLRESIHGVLGWLADPCGALRVGAAAGATVDQDSWQRVSEAPTLPALLGDCAGELIDRTLDAMEETPADLGGVARVWARGLGPVLAPLVEVVLAEFFRVARGARTSSSPPPSVGGYTLRRRLREGGMGTTWLVSRATTAGGDGALFVMKRPRSAGLRRHEDRARFGALLRQEASRLTALRHFNVVQFIDHGEAVDGDAYLVMEHLRGADLEEYARARVLSLRELQAIAPGVIRGLQRLHAARMVHRDVKPSNVFLCMDLTSGQPFDPALHRDPDACPIERAVVIDLGIVFDAPSSALAGGGTPSLPPPAHGVGTPGFMAPEQWLAETVTPAADVYGLAATVYAVTTGRPFFSALKPEEKLRATLAREPLVDAEAVRGLSRGLAELLRDATRRDPARRIDLEAFGRRLARLR